MTTNSSPSKNRILLVNQFFYPDVSGGSQYLTDLAVDLEREDFDVHVLAGERAYDGRTRLSGTPGTGGSITVHRLRLPPFRKNNVSSHIAGYVFFFLQAFWKCLRIPRPDVVITMSTPPLLGLMGTFLKRFRSARHIAWIQDVYPEIACALGLLKPRSPITRLLRRLDTHALRRADAVVALGEDMKRRLLERGFQGLAASRLHVIRDWVDADTIRPVSHATNPFRARHGLENAFVVLYSGNMGWCHDFAAVRETALRLRHHPRVRFCFIGDGAKKAELMDFQRGERLENTLFLPYQDRAALPETLPAADVSLVTLAAGFEGLVVPSKIYGALAAGRPVVFVGDVSSEPARIVREAACGFVTAPDDPSALEKALVQLESDADLQTRMGANARKAAVRDFTRSQGTKQFMALIGAVLE